jgi:hypothetical protein
VRTLVLTIIALLVMSIPSLSRDKIPKSHSHLQDAETTSWDKLEAKSPSFEAQ